MDKLGLHGTDKITGFKGIVTAKIIYLYGCSQYLLNPPIGKDGKRPEGEYFDEGRITFGKRAVTAKEVTAKENGCETREYPR